MTEVKLSDVVERKTSPPDMETLKSVRSADNKHNLPDGIKDCVKLALADGCQGQGSEAKNLLHFIVTEFKSNGVDDGKAKRILTSWNNKGSKARLPEAEIMGTIRRTYRKNKDYHYSCKNAMDRYFQNNYCEAIGREACEYYRKNYSNKKGKYDKYQTHYNYWSYGWQKITTNAGHKLYTALVNIERKEGKTAGYPFIKSYRQIRKLSGITKVKQVAKGLTDKGLIKFKPGVSGQYSRQGSKFQRIIPIPKVPAGLKE